METKKKLTRKEKFAYGLGAVGKDMVYMLSVSYILYYFQDIMGVNAIAMGIILLVARIFDAFNDPIMGVLVAKTKTRWGKFRPWLFIGTLTNAIILVVMFSAPPSLDGKGLVAYAAVTYILWGVTYTMMDIPYWSMVPAFTEGGKEREGLSALARACAGVGSAIITIITVMAVAMLGSKFAANSTTNKELIIGADKEVVVYVVEQKGDKSTTGNVLEFNNKDQQVDISLTANENLYEGMINLSEKNTKYDITVGDVKLTKDNSTMSFAMDSVDSKSAVMELVVSEDQYSEIAASSGTVTADISSTVEAERLGFKYFTIIIAILFFVFICVTCICVKEKSSVDVQTASVKDMFKALVQNDQAMAFVITIVLVNTATYITSNLVIYFFKYDLGGSNWEGNYTTFNIFGGGIQILAMLLFFPLLRKFFRSIKIFYICMGSAVFGYLILLGLSLGGANTVTPFLVPCFFIMAAVGMLNVIVTVFLANTVDYGELKNGRRDESVIFSMQTFVVKLASGISALIASICLSVFHIAEENGKALVDNSAYATVLDHIQKVKTNTILESIDASSVIGLRLTMTLAPIVVLLIAVVIFKKHYILTDEKLEEISLSLKTRRNV